MQARPSFECQVSRLQRMPVLRPQLVRSVRATIPAVVNKLIFYVYPSHQENEKDDVYIDLLYGQNLYDKIRVQTQLL